MKATLEALGVLIFALGIIAVAALIETLVIARIVAH